MRARAAQSQLGAAWRPQPQNSTAAAEKGRRAFFATLARPRSHKNREWERDISSFSSGSKKQQRRCPDALFMTLFDYIFRRTNIVRTQKHAVCIMWGSTFSLPTIYLPLSSFGWSWSSNTLIVKYQKSIEEKDFMLIFFGTELKLCVGIEWPPFRLKLFAWHLELIFLNNFLWFLIEWNWKDYIMCQSNLIRG